MKTYDYIHYKKYTSVTFWVEQKKFYAHARIMVMRNNERGEYRLRTLIDRKRKHYENAVDVFVHLHDLIDPSTERTTPPSSAHVQLSDVP